MLPQLLKPDPHLLISYCDMGPDAKEGNRLKDHMKHLRAYKKEKVEVTPMQLSTYYKEHLANDQMN